MKYSTGDETGADELLLEAEQACAEIITAITNLTEQDADLVEPAFTDFEKQLLTLTAHHFRGNETHGTLPPGIG